MKITDLKPGDILFPDAGFDCLKLNEPCEVKQDDGGLYVECDDEEYGPTTHHYLEGQLDFNDGETLVGLADKPWPA